MLAFLLFGKPVQTEIAERAYRTLIAEHLTSADAILNAGWDKLVILLDQAHYVYDFSTAMRLLDVARDLRSSCRTITNLLAQARTPRELPEELQEFRHIGPVTARIFLRQIWPVWHRKSAR
ncbi:MAG TPA: hypothetical protein VE994_09240 [Terriglobales bacterium]|nr:hypothetical protein [Terriglobales bacterium]